MGLSSSKKHDKKITVTIIGNSNAGKTSISQKIKGAKFYKTVPTLGLQQVNFVRNKTLININDLGGNASMTKIWDNYFAESHGIIYVIDSNEWNHLESSIKQLQNIAIHQQIVDKPIFVVINKCDIKNSIRSCDAEKLLDVTQYKDMLLTVTSCTEKDNDAYKLFMADFDDFVMKIVTNYKTLTDRIAVDLQSKKAMAESKMNQSEKNEKINDESVPSIFSRRSTLMDTVKNVNPPLDETLNKESLENKVFEENLPENQNKQKIETSEQTEIASNVDEPKLAETPNLGTDQIAETEETVEVTQNNVHFEDNTTNENLPENQNKQKIETSEQNEIAPNVDKTKLEETPNLGTDETVKTEETVKVTQNNVHFDDANIEQVLPSEDNTENKLENKLVENNSLEI